MGHFYFNYLEMLITGIKSESPRSLVVGVCQRLFLLHLSQNSYAGISSHGK
jgi:hypothetical protein